MPLPAEAVAGCRLDEESAGRYRLSGDLGFIAAADLLQRGRAAFAGHRSVRIDLSEVSDADSAGLAVLLQWVREARREGRELFFAHLPKRLADLARISGVSDFVPVARD